MRVGVTDQGTRLGDIGSAVTEAKGIGSDGVSGIQIGRT